MNYALSFVTLLNEQHILVWHYKLTNCFTQWYCKTQLHFFLYEWLTQNQAVEWAVTCLYIQLLQQFF